MEDFQLLLNDRTSGSMELLKKFIQIIKAKNPNHDVLIQMANQFSSKFHDMAVIQNSIERLLSETNKTGNVKKSVETLEKTIEEIDKKLIEKSKSVIRKQDKLLTISNSNMLRTVLVAIKPKLVFVLKSLPGGEGRVLFKELKGKINAILIEDEQGYEKILKKEIDKVIISCDAVFPEVGFVNKVGTAKVCKMAADKDIPIVLLANFLKLIHQKPDKIDSELLEWVEWNSKIRLVLAT